jgi:hypothetical protein
LTSQAFDYFASNWNIHSCCLLYRFLPEEVFVSKTFHACLLAGQLVVLTGCASYWWRFLTTYAKLKAGGPPSQC